MNLREKRAAAIKAAEAIVNAAKSDNRDLTPEEQTEVEAKMAEVEELDKQIKGRQLVDSVMRLGTTTTEPDSEKPTQAKTLGEHFAKSVNADQLGRLKAISGYTVSTPEFAPELKANTDPHLTTGAVFGDYLTTFDRTVVQGFRPGPVVADLMGSGTISGNAVTYLVEGALEGAFATVAEGGAKPQIHFADPTTRTDALKKLAAWWDNSDEMVEDLAFMVSEINQRGMYQLALAEENQLLNGPGTGSTVQGLANRSGIQTEVQAVAPDTAADTLFRAMTKVQTATGLSADAIVIHPNDYQALRLSKDSNGQYYGGGFFSGQYGVGGVPEQPPLWGLRTVVSTAVAAKTVWVGAFRAGATVYRKGGIRVESTNSDAGKFTSNLITTRIEERIALAVRIPGAFVKVTLL